MIARIIKCPQCGKPTAYDPTNPSRPFCSERCKLIDLGEWASNKYAVPVAKQGNHENDIDDVDEEQLAEKKQSDLNPDDDADTD